MSEFLTGEHDVVVHAGLLTTSEICEECKSFASKLGRDAEIPRLVSLQDISLFFNGERR